MSKKHKGGVLPNRTYGGKTKVFAYGTLNLHDVQMAIWGESMSGHPAFLLDYELRSYGSNIFYIVKKFGETVSGKIYELTKEQLDATDAYEGGAYERVQVKIGDSLVQTYIQNKEILKHEDTKADN